MATSKFQKKQKPVTREEKTAEYVTGSKEIKDSKEAKPVTKEAKTRSMLPAQRKLKLNYRILIFAFFTFKKSDN